MQLRLVCRVIRGCASLRLCHCHLPRPSPVVVVAAGEPSVLVLSALVLSALVLAAAAEAGGDGGSSLLLWPMHGSANACAPSTILGVSGLLAHVAQPALKLDALVQPRSRRNVRATRERTPAWQYSTTLLSLLGSTTPFTTASSPMSALTSACRRAASGTLTAEGMCPWRNSDGSRTSMINAVPLQTCSSISCDDVSFSCGGDVCR